MMKKTLFALINLMLLPFCVNAGLYKFVDKQLTITGPLSPSTKSYTWTITSTSLDDMNVYPSPAPATRGDCIWYAPNGFCSAYKDWKWNYVYYPDSVKHPNGVTYHGQAWVRLDLNTIIDSKYSAWVPTGVGIEHRSTNDSQGDNTYRIHDRATQYITVSGYTADEYTETTTIAGRVNINYSEDVPYTFTSVRRYKRVYPTIATTVPTIKLDCLIGTECKTRIPVTVTSDVSVPVTVKWAATPGVKYYDGGAWVDELSSVQNGSGNAEAEIKLDQQSPGNYVYNINISASYN